MKLKVCFKCKEEKPLSEFYRHKKMYDGVVGKCKTCTKEDVRKREAELRKNDSVWVEKERKRAREKYHRLNYRNKKTSVEVSRKRSQNYKEKYPEKVKATRAAQKLPRRRYYHNHHWSYNEEHFKDVIELSIKGHNKLHRYLKYDKSTKFFMTIDGRILDTKQKHINYSITVLKNGR